MEAVRKRKLVAMSAVLGMGLVLLLTAGAIRASGLASDDGSTTEIVREAAEHAILRAHADEAASWPDVRQRLRVSILRLLEEPYVADVWLVRGNGGGLVSFASGGPGAQGDQIVQLAGVIGEAAMAADTWATAGVERYVPVAVAAMSRDGDHADVLRYLAVPVTFANGDGAIVAVSYDRTPGAGNPGVLYALLLLGGLGSLAASAYLGFSAWRHAPRTA